MSDSEPTLPAGPPEGDPAASATETCAECSTALAPGNRVPAGGRVFCRACYASLRAELEQAAEAMSTDVNYANAILGALLGGVAGALAWWGFTVLTGISFGLVAIAIGLAVGHGTVRFAGGKHSRGLQAVSVTFALASWVAASYLVNMTFINRALARQGDAFRVPFPPLDPALALRVLGMNFGFMDVVFIAIVVWEAWKIPRPIVLPPDASA